MIWSEDAMVNLGLNKTAWHQHRFSFSMWAALKVLRLAEIRYSWFQQDSAAAHKSRHKCANICQIYFQRTG